jgi:hypothetical protein
MQLNEVQPNVPIDADSQSPLWPWLRKPSRAEFYLADCFRLL